MDLSNIMPRLQEFVAFYGIRVVAAVAIFIIGRWVAKAIRNFVRRLMERGKVDVTLVSFVGNLTYILLLTFVVIAALFRSVFKPPRSLPCSVPLVWPLVWRCRAPSQTLLQGFY